MFIGRSRELVALNRAFARGGFEFFVIYGRRRIGKTALIQEFIKDKPAIYYMGIEASTADNLALLSSAIAADYTASDVTYGSMHAALEDVFRKAESGRLVLVLDEYPYMAKADQSLASALQVLIDRYRDSSNLMLILCGSSVSYMEDDVLAYKSPLYGRKTGQIRLRPMDFLDSQRFHPRLSAGDRALAYGLVGGTPHYLKQIDDSRTMAQNIRDHLLDPTALLFDEPRNLLVQSLNRPALYNSIMRAVAEGAVRVKEIADRTGEATSAVSNYLRTLQEMELISRETPYGEKTSKRSLYMLQDNLFRFWYRFIARNLSALSLGKADRVYERIEPHLSHFMGPVFEDIARQYLWRRLGDGYIPADFQDLGRWWGTDPRTRSRVEFDIVGSDDEHTALVGECKWSAAPVEADVLDTLIYKAAVLPYPRKHFALFARNGFTEDCRARAAAEKNVTLVTLDDIVSYGDEIARAQECIS